MFATAIVYGMLRHADTMPGRVRFRAEEGTALPDGRIEWVPIITEPEISQMAARGASPYRLRLTSDRAADVSPSLIRLSASTRLTRVTRDIRISFARCHAPSDSTELNLLLAGD
jgi:hypothetical protein